MRPGNRHSHVWVVSGAGLLPGQRDREPVPRFDQVVSAAWGLSLPFVRVRCGGCRWQRSGGESASQRRTTNNLTIMPGPTATRSGNPLPCVAVPQGELLTVNENNIPLLRDTLAPGVHAKPLRLDLGPHSVRRPGPRRHQRRGGLESPHLTCRSEPGRRDRVRSRITCQICVYTAIFGPS
jgi:hypothetical protein